MKTTSRLLGCIAIASALGVAPSAFAAKGGPSTSAVRPTTTATFQPAQDPLGPRPSPSTGVGSSAAGSGHVFRVIPPPAKGSGEVETFTQRPVIFTMRPTTSVDNLQSTAGSFRSSAGTLRPRTSGQSSANSFRSTAGTADMTPNGQPATP
jgi:hypothetical protein